MSAVGVQLPRDQRRFDSRQLLLQISDRRPQFVTEHRQHLLPTGIDVDQGCVACQGARQLGPQLVQLSRVVLPISGLLRAQTPAGQERRDQRDQQHHHQCGQRHRRRIAGDAVTDRPDRYPTVESLVGQTPLVRLQRLPGTTTNLILGKLEGNNPAGSVKDRPALSMIARAEERGDIRPGDTLIEATSGNTACC